MVKSLLSWSEPHCEPIVKPIQGRLLDCVSIPCLTLFLNLLFLSFSLNCLLVRFSFHWCLFSLSQDLCIPSDNFGLYPCRFHHQSLSSLMLLVVHLLQPHHILSHMYCSLHRTPHLIA